MAKQKIVYSDRPIGSSTPKGRIVECPVCRYPALLVDDGAKRGPFVLYVHESEKRGLQKWTYTKIHKVRVPETPEPKQDH